MDRIFHGKRETAATLGISVRTLENLVAMREITPRRIGRRVLFEMREIERFARRDHRTKQKPDTDAPALEAAEVCDGHSATNQ